MSNLFSAYRVEDVRGDTLVFRVQHKAGCPGQSAVVVLGINRHTASANHIDGILCSTRVVHAICSSCGPCDIL